MINKEISEIDNIEILIKDYFITNNLKNIYKEEIFQKFDLILEIFKKNEKKLFNNKIIYNFVSIFENKFPLFVPLYIKEDEDLYMNIIYGNKEKVKLIKLNQYFYDLINQDCKNKNIEKKLINCCNESNNKIEYYCKDCYKNMCKQCSKEHLNHNLEKINLLNENIINIIIKNLMNGLNNIKYINDFIDKNEKYKNINIKFKKFKEQIKVQIILFFIFYFIYYDYISENLLIYEVIYNIKLFYKIDKNHLIKTFKFKDENNINENIEQINLYINDPNNYFLKIYKISSKENLELININNDYYFILYKNLSNILISHNKFEIYKGEIKNGIKNGKGKLITNNFIYEGNFKENNFFGFGKYINFNGNIYKGYFKENKFNGKGMIIFSNGDFFYGNFIDNNMFGKGIYFFSGNYKIIEFWKNNNIYSSTENIDLNLIQNFFDEDNKNIIDSTSNEINKLNINLLIENKINNNEQTEKIKLKKQNNNKILDYEYFNLKDKINLNNTIINYREIEYLTHRCEKCSLLLKFNNLYSYKNQIYIRYICDNKHEGIDTIENVYKNTFKFSFNYVLCNICKKTFFDDNSISFYLCTFENKIYCNEHVYYYCLNHGDKLININEIDFYCKNLINKNIFYCENCEENFSENFEQLNKHINHKFFIIENEYLKINLNEIENNIKKNIDIYNKNIKIIKNFLNQIEDKINNVIYNEIENLFKNYINNNLLSLRFCIESYLIYKNKIKEKSNNNNYIIIFNFKNFCLNINLIEFNINNYNNNIEEIVINLIEFLTNFNNFLFKNIVNFEDNLNEILIENYNLEKNNSLEKEIKLIKKENLLIFGEILKGKEIFDDNKIIIDLKKGNKKENYNNNEINDDLNTIKINNNEKYFINNINYFDISSYIIENISNKYFSINNTESKKNDIKIYDIYYKGKYINGMWNGKGMLKLNDNKNEYKIKYEGYFKNNLFHGKGKYYFNNGDIFEGDFINNILYKGLLQFKNGYIYIGKLLNNKFHGLGILKNKEKKFKLLTIFENNIPKDLQIINQNEFKIYQNKEYTYIFQHGKIKFLGEFKKNRINGFGEIIIYNEKKEIKEIFKANFENNLFREGIGIKYNKDESINNIIISNRIISNFYLEYEKLIIDYNESFESFIPRCKDCFFIPRIEIKISDKKLTIETKCLNGHKNKPSIKFEFFNFNNHKCSICNEKNQKENRLYYCHTCKQFFCESDVINCMLEMHKILININYFGFICLEHNKFYNFYCSKCLNNFCENCNFCKCGEKNYLINLNENNYDFKFLEKINKAINISKKNIKNIKNIINERINDKYSIILCEKFNKLLYLFKEYKIYNYEIISFFYSYLNFYIKKLPNNSTNINNLKYKLLINIQKSKKKIENEQIKYKNNIKEQNNKNEKEVYKIIKYENGDIYKGELFKDKKNGFGIYKYINGDIYEGEFFEDKKDGFGIYKYINGDTYIGEFIHDKRGQYGILYYENDGFFEGGFLNNEKFFGSEFLNNEIYKGRFEENKRDYGILIKNECEFFYKNGIITILYNNK